MPNNDLYKQLPMMHSDGICPRCKRKINSTQNATVAVYSKHFTEYQEVNVDLLQCKMCGICCGTPEIFKKLRLSSNGYNARGFAVTSKSSPSHINEKANAFPPEYDKAQKIIAIYNNSNITPAVDDNGIADLTIYFISTNYSYCPICDKPLSRKRILIPINAEKSATWCGYSCGTHFLSLPHSELTDMVRSSSYRKHIKINRDYCFANYINAKDCFEKNANAQIMILLKSTQKSVNDLAVIISNCSDSPSKNIMVLDYKDELTRELITQIQRYNSHTVPMEGNTYNVFHVFSKHRYEIFADWLLDLIIIRKDGGYSRSCVNSNFELVDVLLFSPYNNRYEVVHATYDKENHEYFMDITVYKHFVQRYGNPGLALYCWRKDNGRGKNYYDELNSESLLFTYGYTVNADDNLSDTQRQNILAEVIDLGLMSQGAIVTLLSSNQRRHHKNIMACRKWEKDITFVNDYKANPQRFIISSKL